MNPLHGLEITEQLLDSIARIDEFKGRWEALGRLAPERLSTLRRIATIESVGSSTRIEGVKLTDDEISKLLSGVDIQSFRSRDEQEVGGYADLMDLIFSSYQDITLTESHIKQLHGVLLKYSEKDSRHRGQYKKLPNQGEAFDGQGRSIGVVFETASPFATPGLMTELVDWTRDALETRTHHPLLVISVFVVHFLAIHPFQDGNGRLSRALSTLLLLRSDYAYVPYSSLERVVEDNKSEYYRTLRRGQATLATDGSQLHKWIAFFIRCLVLQKDALAHKIENERLLAPVAPLSAELLGIVDAHGRVTVRQAVALTGANRNTIRHHLKKLVAAGSLAQRGTGRGTWYEKE